MRANGVAEKYCTGNASDWAKFEKWSETLTHCLRNPLYHWTHLELNRPLGIHDRLLGPETARSIWEEGNARLAEPDFSCRGILRQMNVALVCTTDDPADSLEHHAILAADPAFETQVLPTWRPDKAMAVDQADRFPTYLDKLGAAANVDIKDYASLLGALRKRIRRSTKRVAGSPTMAWTASTPTPIRRRSSRRSLPKAAPASR